MTIPEVRALLAYWRINPPTHQLVAMLAGYKPDEISEQNSQPAEEIGEHCSAEEFDSVLAQFGIGK